MRKLLNWFPSYVIKVTRQTMSSHATLQTRLTSVVKTIERIFFGKLSGKN